MSLFGEEVVPRIRHVLTPAFTLDRTAAEPSSSPLPLVQPYYSVL
jgi:hypothetical protein